MVMGTAEDTETSVFHPAESDRASASGCSPGLLEKRDEPHMDNFRQAPNPINK